MRTRSIAWASAACLPLAGAFSLWSRWYADRMEASGHGWEMAFYFSPLAFWVMDGILLAGAILGVIGAACGPQWNHRAVAAGAGLACIVLFIYLP